MSPIAVVSDHSPRSGWEPPVTRDLHEEHLARTRSLIVPFLLRVPVDMHFRNSMTATLADSLALVAFEHESSVTWARMASVVAAARAERIFLVVVAVRDAAEAERVTLLVGKRRLAAR